MESNSLLMAIVVAARSNLSAVISTGYLPARDSSVKSCIPLNREGKYTRSRRASVIVLRGSFLC